MAGGIFVGSVYATMELQTGTFAGDVNRANKILGDFDKQVGASTKNTRSFATDANQAFGSIANGLSSVIKPLVAFTTAGAFGFSAMAKASFDQVRQVEDATFALRAYEKDGAKVNTILKDLVAYARSDMGVLFQRQDLFKAASNLRGFGEAAENVTDRVKILSKGVALGMTNFDELSQIVGRSASAGKLTAEAYDQLAYRGIILDKSLRGASVSADDLYKALDGAIDDKVLDGRANTISGMLIRMQSAFRDLGAQILGVDKETTTFVKGGLGDTMMSALADLTAALKNPAVKQALADMGNSFGGFAKNAVPVFVNGLVFMAKNISTIIPAVIALGAAFATAKIGQQITGIVTAFQTMTKATLITNLVVVAIVALVAALVFIETKFGGVTKAIEWFNSVAQAVAAWVSSTFTTAITALGDAYNTVSGAITSFVSGAITNFQNAMATTKQFIDDNIVAIRIAAGVLTALFGPALLKLGVQATIAGAQAAAGAVVAGAAWVKQAAISSAAWVVWQAKMAFISVAIRAMMIKDAILASAAWVKNAVVSSAAWVANFAVMSARAVAAGVVMTAQAVASGWAWVAAGVRIAAVGVAMGAVRVATVAYTAAQWALNAALNANPISLIIIAIAALVAGIVLLWNRSETFRNIVTKAFEAVGKAVTAVFNGIRVALAAAGKVIGVLFDIYFKIPLEILIYIIKSLASIFTSVFGAIVSIVTTVGSTIAQIIGVVLVGTFMWLWNNVLIPMGAFFVTVFTAIQNVVTTVVNAVAGVITTVFTAIWGFISTVWNAYVSIVTTVVFAIFNVVSTIFNNVRNFITTVFNNVRTFVVTVWNAYVSIISGVLNAIWSVVTTIFNNVRNFISSVFNTVAGIVSSIWNGIRNTVVNVATGIWNAVTNTFNNVVNSVRNGMQNALNTVTGFVGNFLNAGKNVIDGIVKGISNGASAVTNKIKEICSGALDAVKNFFGIKSPSRVMAKMGGYLMQGFGIGVEREENSMIKTMYDASNAVQRAFDPNLSSTGTVDYSAVASGDGSGYNGTMTAPVHETNIYGNVIAPQADNNESLIDQMNRADELSQRDMATAPGM